MDLNNNLSLGLGIVARYVGTCTMQNFKNKSYDGQLLGSNKKTHRTIFWCLSSSGVLHIKMVANIEKCSLRGTTWSI